MIHFSLPTDHRKARRKTAAVLHIVPVMTPDRYLVLRREAAGVTPATVAARMAQRRRSLNAAIGSTAALERQALDLIQQLEMPGVKARMRETVEALAAEFPLDVDVYFQLADEPAERHPFVCHGCGCSIYDPCSGSAGVCSWASPNACTRCIGRDADTAAAS